MQHDPDVYSPKASTYFIVEVKGLGINLCKALLFGLQAERINEF